MSGVLGLLALRTSRGGSVVRLACQWSRCLCTLQGMGCALGLGGLEVAASPAPAPMARNLPALVRCELSSALLVRVGVCGCVWVHVGVHVQVDMSGSQPPGSHGPHVPCAPWGVGRL